MWGTIVAMAFWLVKTEPHVYSIDDLRRDTVTAWTGVRNYQARNFLKQMEVGDLVLVYHSNAEPPGVVGIARVKHVAKPDPTQFDRASEYFDPAASPDKPRWFCPDLAFSAKLSSMVSLEALRGKTSLSGLPLLQRGSRLSVLPVTEKHFEIIQSMGSERA
jgi:predicted RNA-binding protein with PUA-like domain